MQLFPVAFNRTITMLQDRNYILNKKTIQITEDQCHVFEPTTIIFVKKKVIIKNQEKYMNIMVHFTLVKFGIKNLREIIKHLIYCSIDHVIFIHYHSLTSQAKKLLQQNKTLTEEIFYFDEMIINPINHVLVPKHELLTPTETTKLLQTFGTNIPCIKSSDRICRHYHGTAGQIFRIYRKHELYYRLVI
jgi:DNA-directed RNA polymerase I, II, and III subunit RPABC1